MLLLGLALEQAGLLGGELRPISLLPASNLHSSQWTHGSVVLNVLLNARGRLRSNAYVIMVKRNTIKIMQYDDLVKYLFTKKFKVITIKMSIISLAQYSIIGILSRETPAFILHVCHNSLSLAGVR